MQHSIALDFDDVLSDTMKNWVKNFNNTHGGTYTKDDVTKWEFCSDFGITEEQMNDLFHKTWENWNELVPLEDNLSKKTQELSQFGTVDIVTSVKSTHTEYVEKWLDKHKIHFSSFVHANHDKEKLDYDYYIDDDPRLAKKLTGTKKHCFLYPQKWNEGVSGDNITRVNNICEVVDSLKIL